MIASIFTTIAMTPLMTMGMQSAHHWMRWRGSWEDALVFLRPAFSEAVDYVGNEIPAYYRDPLCPALAQLCDPDPSTRGDPKERRLGGNTFQLHRYVSLFNRLARRAEYEMTASN